jgi:hypothetical protein
LLPPRSFPPLASTVVARAAVAFYIRAERGLLPPRASDMRAVRNRAIDGRGLSPPRSAALLAAPGPSLHGLRRGRALFVRLLHRSYSLVRLLIRVHAHRSAVAFMSRSGVPLRTRVRSPSFRTKDVSTCMGSTTARGSSSASHLRGEDVAFSSTARDRHLEIRPVSPLDTQPMVTPVNA